MMTIIHIPTDDSQKWEGWKKWYTALSISLQCLRRRIRRLQGPRSFRVDSLGSLIESVRESVTMPREDNLVLLASNAASACKHLSSATLLSVRASQPGSSRIGIKEKPSVFLNPWIKDNSSMQDYTFVRGGSKIWTTAAHKREPSFLRSRLEWPMVVALEDGARRKLSMRWKLFGKRELEGR